MSDERSILSLGFSDVLVKPVAPSELLRRIRAQLDRRLSEQRGDARRLLLLDDNEARHDALRSEFARRHFPLFSACGTLDTLINGELPDSILCNIDTPEGYKLVRQLRADERFAQVPLVLARSGEVTAADRRLAKRAAASAVVRYGPGAYQTVSAVALALEQDHSPRSASASALSSKLTSDSARRASESRREQAGRAISNMLSDLARHQRDSRPPRYVVESALASFLDAGGFTKGAGYAVDSDGKLRLTCSLGFPEIAAKGLDAFWGHMAVLHDSMSRPEPTELTLELGEHCSLLRAAALKSIIVIPVASGGAPLGILFAGSQNATLPAYSHEIAVRAGALLAQVFEINSTRRSLRP
jgi:CheY-like chemotaxis protein